MKTKSLYLKKGRTTTQLLFFMFIRPRTHASLTKLQEEHEKDLYEYYIFESLDIYREKDAIYPSDKMPFFILASLYFLQVFFLLCRLILTVLRLCH